MIDINYISANRHGRIFHMFHIPGKNTVGHDWEFLRVAQSLDSRAKQYIFARPNSKNPDKRIELALTYSQLERVYEVTASNQPENFRIDLSRLEAFQYQ